MTQTWYILEDETCADPRDVKTGSDGKLVHKDGRKVAYAPHGPRSRSVDPEAEKAKPKGKTEAKKADPKKADDKPVLDHDGHPPSDKKPEEEKPKIETKDMKAEEPKRTYKTRETKAD